MMRHVAAVVVGVALLAGVAGAQAVDPKVEAGKKLYESAKCTMCHGPAGKGMNQKLILVGNPLKVTDPDIRKWLTATLEMEAKMLKPPAVKMSTMVKPGKFTDADVDALVAYLKSLK